MTELPLPCAGRGERRASSAPRRGCLWPACGQDRRSCRSATLPLQAIPAAATMPSMPPMAAAAASIAATSSPSTATSALNARPSVMAVLSIVATLAPALRNAVVHASPIPDAAPVTAIRRPSARRTERAIYRYRPTRRKRGHTKDRCHGKNHDDGGIHARVDALPHHAPYICRHASTPRRW